LLVYTYVLFNFGAQFRLEKAFLTNNSVLFSGPISSRGQVYMNQKGGNIIFI